MSNLRDNNKIPKISANNWGVKSSSYYFPEEIVYEILLKLPIKCLIKCSAVCKSWNALIKSHAFAQTHISQRIRNDDAPHLILLMAMGKSAPFWLHWNNPGFKEYSNLVNPIYNEKEIEVRNCRVIGTCNGLICFDTKDYPIIIWNPTIRKFGFLPPPPPNKENRPVCELEFCYDSRVNDYKVLRMLRGLSSLDKIIQFDVWSLSTASWKSLSAAVIPTGFHAFLGGDRPAFVNGVFHWIRLRRSNREDDCYDAFIVTFDVADESFGELAVHELKYWPHAHIYISTYGDCLAMFEIPCDGLALDLWVMKEYRVAESWTKLFNISVGQISIRFRPFVLRRSGQVVVIMGLMGDHKRPLIYVDPRHKQIEHLGIEEYDYIFMDSFVENLVLLGQTNVFSY